MVRKERLELSRLATLEPKSSVSTNSTTPAKNPELYPNKLNSSLLRNRFHYLIAIPIQLFIKLNNLTHNHQGWGMDIFSF